MRSDNLDDDDDDIPQSADPVSPIQPLSAVSSYAAGDASAMAGGFGAPGANYSYVPSPFFAPCTLQFNCKYSNETGRYPYGAQGAVRQPATQSITSQAHSRNNSPGSSGVGVGYSLGAPEAGPEPLAPYFRTGQERNLVGYETIPIPNSNPLPFVPSLSILPTTPSHSSHHSVSSFHPQPPLISFDSCSPSPSSLSPQSSSSFDVSSSLLPSPGSSFSLPSYSSHGLAVPGMSPTSPTPSSSPYAAPQPFIPVSGLEWLRLEDFPSSSGTYVGYQ